MRTLAVVLFVAGLCATSLTGAAETPSLAMLVQQLTSEDRRDQVEAALALEALGPKAAQAAPDLVVALKFRPIRAQASRALVAIGPATVPFLFDALRNADTPQAQREAVRKVLLRLGPRILPKLLEAARAFDPLLRNDAIAILGKFEPPPAAAFPVLLDNALEPRVRIEFPAVPAPNEVFIDIGQDDGLVIQIDPDGSSYVAGKALTRFGPKAMPIFLAAMENDRWQLPRWLPNAPALAGHFLFGGWGAHALRDPLQFQEWANRQIPRVTREWRDPRRHTRLLALQGLSYLRDLDPETFAEQSAAKIIPAVARALKDQDISIRLEAAQFLGNMGPVARPAISALVEALKDTGYIPPAPVGLQSQSSLPLYCARALQQIGPMGVDALAQKGLPILIEQLQNKDRRVRDYAALALAVLEKRARPVVPMVLEQLIGQMRSQREAEKKKGRRLMETPWEPYYYEDALHQIGAAAVPDLQKLLAEDDPDIRQLGLRILEHMGEQGKAAVPALIAMLNEKETKENRCAAVRTLGAMGRWAFSAANALRKACADEDVTIVYSAAMALHEVDPWAPESARVLGSLIRDGNTDYRWNIHLLQRLAKWGRQARPAAVDLAAILQRKLDEENAQLSVAQREAAVALFRIAPEQKLTSVLTLARLMKAGDGKAALALADLDPKHKDLSSALAAFLKEEEKQKNLFLDALGRIGAYGQPVLPILLDHLKGSSGWQALSGLETMGPAAKKALPALLAALETWDENRLEIISALVTIAPEASDVYTALMKLLEDPDEPDCGWAAAALGRIGAPAGKAVPRLKSLLKHATVRLDAAEALIKITGQETPYMGVIVKALSERRDMQLAAATSIVELGNRARVAVPALRTILKKWTDPELLAAALDALAAIGPDAASAQRDVIPHLQNKNYYVRLSAIKGLAEFADASALPTLAVFIQENERWLAEEAEKARDRVRLRQKGL